MAILSNKYHRNLLSSLISFIAKDTRKQQSRNAFRWIISSRMRYRGLAEIAIIVFVMNSRTPRAKHRRCRRCLKRRGKKEGGKHVERVHPGLSSTRLRELTTRWPCTGAVLTVRKTCNPPRQAADCTLFSFVTCSDAPWL